MQLNTTHRVAKKIILNYYFARPLRKFFRKIKTKTKTGMIITCKAADARPWPATQRAFSSDLQFASNRSCDRHLYLYFNSKYCTIAASTAQLSCVQTQVPSLVTLLLKRILFSCNFETIYFATLQYRYIHCWKTRTKVARSKPTTFIIFALKLQ